MSRFHVVFGCRPDRGRDARRNSANASIVSQRLHYQRRFYLRPKFRQLQRLLGPAYLKSANPKQVSDGFTVSLAHASGYQKLRVLPLTKRYGFFALTEVRVP